MSVQFCPFFRIELEEHTKFHVIQLGRFVSWRMLEASDSLKRAKVEEQVTAIPRPVGCVAPLDAPFPPTEIGALEKRNVPYGVSRASALG